MRLPSVNAQQLRIVISEYCQIIAKIRTPPLPEPSSPEHWQTCAMNTECFENMRQSNSASHLHSGSPSENLQMPDEQKMLLPEGAGLNQIFQEVGVNFQDAVVYRPVQRLPPF